MSTKISILARAALARLRHAFGHRTPLRVLHRITTRCNLECAFCDHQEHRRQKQELTTEELKLCMTQFAKLGTVTWGVTGGEVFLRQDLMDILRHANGLGFLTSLITNGTVASADQIAEGSRYLDFLVTSVDGPPETMDQLRGKGVFAKVSATINLARSHGLPVIAASLLTKEFIESDGIRFMGQFAREMGVRVSFQNLLLTGPYGGNGLQEIKPTILEHDPSQELLFDALDQIMAMRQEGYPFVNNQPWVDYVKRYLQGNPPRMTCYAGRLYCNFFEDGSLRTCQYHPVRIKESTIAASFDQLPGTFAQCPCLAICYINYNLAFDLNPRMILDGLHNAFFPGLLAPPSRKG